MAVAVAIEDTRDYLELLGEHGQAAFVEREVDPDWEVGLLARELMDRQGPMAVFKNVRGSSWPVALNLFPHRQRCALALGVQEQDLMAVWLRAIEEPIPPVMVDSGPCQEVLRTNGDLLADIPRVTWNPDDGGPFITFGLSICKDPESGRRNMGIYRMQIKGDNRLGWNSTPPADGGVFHARAELRGEPLPIAIAIGGDPALYLASQAPRAYAQDEVALAGALRGRPVPMVKCKTVDLEVPTSAEIVLEGHVLAGVREVEGPFGEFTGYYSGAAHRRVIQLSAITHRRQPIFVASYTGKPPTNDQVIHSLAREPIWYRMLKREVCPTIKDIHVTYGGSSALHVIVSMKPLREGQARNVGLELIKVSTIKHVVVVDDDIDVRDPTAVEWAIATRVQADRDVLIIPNLAGMGLDPSQPKFPSGLSAKMIIDATIKPGGSEALVKLPQDRLDTVRSRWAEYGFGGF